MSPDNVNPKIKKPLTKGWIITSEPLGPDSKVTLDFKGCLNLKVKLKEALPGTTYTIGLNLYGTDLSILGGVSRFAFDPTAKTINGVSKRRINQYELGTVKTDEKGKAAFKRILPVNPGTYDVQVWAVKGRPRDVPAICYKSGETFGDSESTTVTNELERIYTVDYFRRHQISRQDHHHIAQIMYEEFQPRSVIDVGCGTALFLEFFHERSVRVTGLEGSIAALEVVDDRIKDRIFIRDVTQPLKGEFEKHDLGICAEVAEHIDTDYSDILVENLIDLSDRIFFTAAQPGRGGRRHVNCQEQVFWIERFGRHDFRLNETVAEKIKRQVATIEELHCRWILRNLMVFEKHA